LVEGIERIAAEKECTAAQIALAWVLAQGTDIVPIAGTKHRTFLGENAEAVRITLASADPVRINRELPIGITTGDRYRPEAMRHLNL
jgi:aryl-alcohol dehydrogenase-like predicted oxidoreductase